MKFFLMCLAFSSLFAKDDLQSIVDNFSDQYDVSGMAVYVMPEDKMVFKGTLSSRSNIDVNAHTIFPVGRITEAFTVMLLAQFVQDGRVKLDDPIKTFLSKSAVLPTFGKKEITLLHLATNTSGLPDLQFEPSTFGTGSLFRFLKTFTLRYAPGTRYQPSSLGYALLTNLLTRIGRQSYPNMIRRSFITPLKMEDTKYSLTANSERRRALGFLKGNWNAPYDSMKLSSVFIGSRGLFSTLDDMKELLSYYMGNEHVTFNNLRPIIKKIYFSLDGEEIALSWLKKGEHYVIESSFYGFTTMMSFNEKSGIVILANRENLPLDTLAKDLYAHLGHKTSSN
ncbi:MAG: D-alanyl-D-alanine-carboxypeptidase/endopeptidase AmpH [Chlamydiia bacterium]|nr:D-alanyl-D-alanine-carboxypeptidase/endopeptidase AmpH [Chlamydiia bacterium]MCH9615679.1 D-alanyl-D-alanine-carboxypeptidase/endopeptidase AmpH [Chlamydiia bacterium]MCH9628918.1 D-alanyl-D-alanine-carboxypeptidase/endopeptidase AmpH [Chlamydiia bacterium]